MDLPKLSKTVLDENFHRQFHGLKLSLNNTVYCIGPYEIKKKVINQLKNSDSGGEGAGGGGGCRDGSKGKPGPGARIPLGAESQKWGAHRRKVGGRGSGDLVSSWGGERPKSSIIS